jgi:hypothetical protein
MTESDKAAQRALITFELGKLLAPVCRLAETSPPPRASEYHIVSAQCWSDKARWMNEVTQFCTFGTYLFAVLYNDITTGVLNLLSEVARFEGTADDAERQTQLRQRLTQCRDNTLALISKVPIEHTARLFEAQTPYSVYLHVKDVICTARRRVHYFDRYLNTDFFDFHMRNLDRSLEIRLVTTRGDADYGVLNVMAVSRLAVVEFTDYQLIECAPADLHDRNLRIDNDVFHLGPSVKNAGTQPTNFSPGDSSPEGHRVLDGIIAAGSVVT